MNKFFGIFSLVCISASCASRGKYEAEELKTSLEVKQVTANENIGVNDDGKVIIQEEQTAAIALRRERKRNEIIRDELSYEQTELDTCRAYLSDPRLGGSGHAEFIRGIDDVKPNIPFREEIGVDENGELKVVNKRYYRDELEGEREYGQNLKQLLRLVSNHRQSCAFKLRQVRLDNGLPADRIRAKGYFTSDGTWVETRQGERSLDDAFEIMAQRKKVFEQE